jgi:DNA-binding protein H-NS
MGTFMKKADFKGMSVDELWALYEKVSAEIAAKIIIEQKVLERRLAALRPPERRPYPTVFPKFRNPDDPSQTWAGRGKQPRWFLTHLSSGRPMEDLRIQQAAE